jgi:hypothetical protein
VYSFLYREGYMDYRLKRGKVQGLFVSEGRKGGEKVSAEIRGISGAKRTV